MTKKQMHKSENHEINEIQIAGTNKSVKKCLKLNYIINDCSLIKLATNHTNKKWKDRTNKVSQQW